MGLPVHHKAAVMDQVPHARDMEGADLVICLPTTIAMVIEGGNFLKQGLISPLCQTGQVINDLLCAWVHGSAPRQPLPSRSSSCTRTSGLTNFEMSPSSRAISLTSFEAIA